ncbi:MAG TPA: glutaredoxin domain-containing protein [Longilinea sp.]|nr:glutaredoxin domain-containing protein [Longilinea sp.]
MAEETKPIIVYGTTWCGDTRRARTILDENKIAYEFIDIDKDMAAREFVEKTNKGFRSVPTMVFPDQTILVEPSSDQLRRKLGLIPLT